MNTDIDTLYNEIIEFCKTASETLGQQVIKSAALSCSTSISQQFKLSEHSGLSASDMSLSDTLSDEEPSCQTADYKTQDISDSIRNQSWSEEEDQVLLEVITNYKKNWDKIKLRIFKLTKKRKTVGFLRRRYAEIVSSTKEKKNTKYTHSEDLMIAHGILNHGFDWIKIASEFSDRDSRSIKNRYYYHISKKNLMDSLTSELNLEEDSKSNENK